jgi:aminoglycoside phosphotransferase (APT) family kinase protein
VGDLPQDVEDLTAEWFAAALQREVTAATVVDRSSGTTGRALVRLAGDDVPPSVFVKLPPFDEQQRALVDATGMGVAEARFYRDLASEVSVRVPGVWYSETDGRDYVMVLEDLTASGCAFPSPQDADIEDRARNIVDELTMLHAQYWSSSRFTDDGDLAWLSERVRYQGGGGARYIERAVETIGDQFDASFHRVAEFYVEHGPQVAPLWFRGTPTVIHGDAHIGNLFVDAADGGRTGFLDWAVVCAAPGIRDVAYVMCNSVPVELREQMERDVVERWCARIGEAGGDVDVEETWEAYCVQALYSWVAAVSTAGMGSKWQASHIGLSSSARATAACTHLHSVEVARSWLR